MRDNCRAGPIRPAAARTGPPADLTDLTDSIDSTTLTALTALTGGRIARIDRRSNPALGPAVGPSAGQPLVLQVEGIRECFPFSSSLVSCANR